MSSYSWAAVQSLTLPMTFMIVLTASGRPTMCKAPMSSFAAPMMLSGAAVCLEFFSW